MKKRLLVLIPIAAVMLFALCALRSPNREARSIFNAFPGQVGNSMVGAVL